MAKLIVSLCIWAVVAVAWAHGNRLEITRGRPDMNSISRRGMDGGVAGGALSGTDVRDRFSEHRRGGAAGALRGVHGLHRMMQNLVKESDEPMGRLSYHRMMQNMRERIGHFQRGMGGRGHGHRRRGQGHGRRGYLNHGLPSFMDRRVRMSQARGQRGDGRFHFGSGMRGQGHMRGDHRMRMDRMDGRMDHRGRGSRFGPRYTAL